MICTWHLQSFELILSNRHTKMNEISPTHPLKEETKIEFLNV
jgi:hypothetical protein